MKARRDSCAQVPAPLHAKVLEEQSRMGIKLNQYVELALTEYTPWRLEVRLTICKEIKQQNIHCKTVLSVDEKADKEISQGSAGQKGRFARQRYLQLGFRSLNK